MKALVGFPSLLVTFFLGTILNREMMSTDAFLSDSLIFRGVTGPRSFSGCHGSRKFSTATATLALLPPPRSEGTTVLRTQSTKIMPLSSHGAQGRQSLLARQQAQVSPDNGTEERRIVYGDDCFGLISLTTLFVARDGFFCATFVAISFVVSILCNTKTLTTTSAPPFLLSDDVSSPETIKKELEQRLPAVVAATTLLVGPVVSQSVSSFLDADDGSGVLSGFLQALSAPETTAQAPPIPPLTLETVVCLFSVFYGFVLSKTFASKDTGR